MLDYVFEFLKNSFAVTGLYVAGSIIALLIISNILYYTNTSDRINSSSPYLDDSSDENDADDESENDDITEIVEVEQPIENIEKFLENTNNLIDNFPDIKNPTYSDILKETFSKTTLKERLENIIRANKPVLIDDIFYPTPCASTLELKVWKQLLNDIMIIEPEYIN